MESLAKEENIVFWLQNEFYYLKNEDKNILMTKDAWPNDGVMDAAQKLICKALSKKWQASSQFSTHKKDQICHPGQ